MAPAAPLPGAGGTVEGVAGGGGDVLAGLAGQVLHPPQDRFEAAAVGDPLLVELGLVGWDQARDGPAALLP